VDINYPQKYLTWQYQSEYSDSVNNDTTLKQESTMQAPTKEQIEKALKESLEREYKRLRKQVKENGLKSLSSSERQFFMEHPNH